MLPKLLRWLPLALVTLAAFWLRTRDLAHRPMHADEANQAVKLGELLDAGRYAFDPRDHHGPTLYYAAVPVAWLRGERSLASLTETTVRLVPALFGTLGVILIAALASPLGRGPALLAAAFVAVSPPAVYYSRYFIQETLLVTFSLAAFLGARAWWRSGLTRWAMVTGACVGLMQATKATAPLFLATAVIAFLIARARGTKPATRRPRRDAAFALIAAFATAALLYSSFGTHLAGVRDAFGAYSHALTRFGGASGPTGHEKQWWYYLQMLGWHRDGLVWHQVVFSALALGGVIVALLTRAPLVRWSAIYTTLILGAFSLFAYKTPWHAVHFVPGMALLASAALAAITKLRTGKLLAAAVALLAFGTQYQQMARVAYLRPADHRNPYAYVHSVADVRKYRPLAEAALARWPQLPVRVITEPGEYWPLPWYLRGLAQVGYWTTPPAESDGSLLIVSASMADDVRPKLRAKYRESFLGLRPGFACIVFTRDEENGPP